MDMAELFAMSEGAHSCKCEGLTTTFTVAPGLDIQRYIRDAAGLQGPMPHRLNQIHL